MKAHLIQTMSCNRKISCHGDITHLLPITVSQFNVTSIKLRGNLRWVFIVTCLYFFVSAFFQPSKFLINFHLYFSQDTLDLTCKLLMLPNGIFIKPEKKLIFSATFLWSTKVKPLRLSACPSESMMLDCRDNVQLNKRVLQINHLIRIKEKSNSSLIRQLAATWPIQDTVLNLVFKTPSNWSRNYHRHKQAICTEPLLVE